MTNKIEEIIANAINGPWPKEGAETYEGHAKAGAQAILTALDAAGLKVLPKEATDEMVRAGIGYSGAWPYMVAAFDPNKWKPAE